MKKIIKLVSQLKQILKSKIALLKTSTYIKLIEKPIKSKYILIDKLGEGKDGVTYIGRIKNQGDSKYIIKIMSRHAKKYSFIVEDIYRNNVQSDNLVSDLKFFNNHYQYPFLELIDVNTNPKDFVHAMKQICDLQISLIKNGFFFWDLGIQHANYMLTKNEKQLKVIDYGGSGFLFIDKSTKIPNDKYKRNLIFARESFIKAAILSHIICYALGKKQFANIASKIQFSNDEELEDIIVHLSQQLTGTVYDEFMKVIVENSLLEEKTWEYVKNVLNKIRNKDFLTQESADISDVIFNPNEIIVTGYQNYVITNKTINPTEGSDTKLWDSKTKFQFICDALEKHKDSFSQPETLADIGANLGMHVFIGKIKYNINKCYGFDYNEEYVDICNKISVNLNLSNCSFSTNSFNRVDGDYDIVIAMGLIHHLFHRTEDYGSLEPILAHFSKITKKSLIIEFPTEYDKKAKKWTMIPGRTKEDDYTLDNFMKYSQRHFSEIIEIGRIGKTRITYILNK